MNRVRSGCYIRQIATAFSRVLELRLITSPVARRNPNLLETIVWLRHRNNRVGVGITIAHDPLHGSGQAAFPHPALALGSNAHAPQRIGMTDRRQRQPASNETPHAIPKDAAVLAPPRQRAMPIPADSEPKNRQRRLVHGHSVVAKVSTHNRPQPLALFGDGFVHSSLKLGFHLIQLRLQPFPYRLPQHREPSIAPLLHADMRKAEKVERLRLSFTTPDRKSTRL